MALNRAAVLGLLLVVSVSASTSNDYWRSFNLTCPDGTGLGSVSSDYSDSFYDRRYKFECDANVGSYNPSTGCFWTKNLRYYGGPSWYSHMCPLNSFPTGIASSYYSNIYDRRWQVRCCSVRMRFDRGCYWKKMGDPGSSFTFKLPSPWVVKSYRADYFDTFNGKTVRDRRWQAYLCMGD